ncbi:SusC/RagA family TonB-linked outer membrane protein [Dysgonomonas capnocytophagoides]|uniref:SusC/RagA family TonB-linked outer membrane protein n=1 Tax=Dysgonomonas capnocytophagoides TaxID=45254 RepID=UPI003340EF9C
MKKKTFREVFPGGRLQIKLRLLTFFLTSVFFSLPMLAQNSSSLVTIKKNRIGVEEAFSIIKEQTHYFIMYENQIIDNRLKLKLDLENVSIEKALDDICSKSGLKYEIMDSHVLITKPGNNKVKNRNNGNQKIITGKIVSAEGDPLPGATVWVVGKSNGTMADASGNYTLDVDYGEILKYSFLGMEDVIKQVGDDRVINVTLPSKSHLLQNIEVVSTGYQTLPKERATGAFATITAKDLEKTPSANVVQRLEGQVPGLQLSLTSGDRSFAYTNTIKSASSQTRNIGSVEYNMNIRGTSTFSGESFPLVVVDGVITEADLSNFNPNDIENITILKDAAAASIWGVRAANGVIVITTKRGTTNTKPRVSFSSNFTFSGKPDINYLKMISSSDMLEYERDLVNSNILTSMPATSYSTAQYYLPEGSRLALQLKEGTISQGEYDQRVASLSSIDSKSQLSKYFLQNSSSQQYNLAVTGGGDNSDYYYSASYSKENTSITRNEGERLTLTLNNNWKLFNTATLSTNFKGAFFSYKNNGTTINSLFPSSGRKLMPYENIADENGNGISYDRLDPSWTSTLSSAFKDWRYNYIDEQRLRDNTQKTNSFSGNINLVVPLFKGVSSSSLVSVERSFSKSKIYFDPESYTFRNLINYYTYPTATSNSLGISAGGNLVGNDVDENNYTFRQQFNYNNVINNIHRINALAGMEMRETNIGQNAYNLYGYNTSTGIANTSINFSTTPTYAWVGGSTPTSYTSFSQGAYAMKLDKRRRFISYYANAAYTLKDRYSFSGSVRYDDYNNFGVERKYRATPLYSFGAKWNLKREKFMDALSWINDLSLRMTYGINGNLSLNTYPFTNIYILSNYVTGQPSAAISSMANPELRWEKVYTNNYGLNFSLFNSRLGGSFDYYTKRSRDLLYSFPIGTAYIGNIGTGLVRNAAALDGRGVDVSLRGIAQKSKDWQTSVGLQFSYNTNEVKKNVFFEENDYMNYYGYYPGGIGLLEGYPTDKLFVYRNAGLDEEGYTQIYDANGEIVKYTTTTIPSIKDLKYAGRKVAPYYGSLNIDLKYRQFSLYALATYQFGGVFLRPTITGYVGSIYNARFDLSEDIAKRWRKPGDETLTSVPRISTNTYSLNRYIYSDINVLKSDYIRMRQISLSYQVDKDLLRKIKIESMQLSLSVNNLGLLWAANNEGYDPDYISSPSTTFNLPPSQSYTIGLNINF